MAARGGRAVIELLGDEDWSVRQSAWAALTNLTGMEFPLNAVAMSAEAQIAGRRLAAMVEQSAAGRRGRSSRAARTAPLGSLAYGATVAMSSRYKGEPSDLVDGQTDGGGFWQTKNAPFPQWCQLDLGRPIEIAQVVVYQYGPEFCLSDCEVAVSLEGENSKR